MMKADVEEPELGLRGDVGQEAMTTGKGNV